MRPQALVAAAFAVCAAAAVFASPEDRFALKPVPAQRVLIVKVDSVFGFGAAFERLAQYCSREAGVRAVLPQMTLSGARDFFAAVAFEGSPRETEDVRILELPPATVATAIHQGPYRLLPQAVRELTDAVRDAGYAPNERAMLRLLHKNSPENHPPEELVTEIQLPVVPRDSASR